jgi:predicted transcriptional regulator
MAHSSLTHDLLQTVIKRAELLACLESDPLDKRELTESLECSRSTIDRAIRELERLNFVRRSDDSFQLTIAGTLVLSEYRRSMTTFESIARVSDLLGDLSAEIPVATPLLREARVLEIPSHAPNEPREEITDLIEDADRIRGFGAADRLPQFRDRLYERTVDGDLDAELILTEELATFLLTEYPQLIEDVIVDGEFDLFTVDSVPYELSIIETPRRSVVFVTLLEDDLSLRGMICNDTSDALEWARGIYRRCRATATPLDPADYHS